MKRFKDHQEATLREQADSERVYSDLLYYHAAQRNVSELDMLAPDLDPKNAQDLLVFELFQGTEPAALAPLANDDTAPWVRYTLMKAFLNRADTEGALGLWKRFLREQVPDALTANTLVQYLLREGQFEQAGNVAAVSLKIADKQRDVLLWKAMAQSRRTLDRELYLDPLPQQREVTFALTTCGAAAYIEQTFAGISAQNYPIFEVVVIDEETGVLPGDASDVGPYRRIAANAGAPWIGAAAACAETPLLVTVPPDCAPAADYVQQFVLALENGVDGIACIGGRVESWYQDKPGDRWRVARMTPEASMQRATVADAVTFEALCLDRAAVLALDKCVAGDAAALARALKSADGETLYLPEAVACCLREDSIESALDAYWQHRLPDRLRAGDFSRASQLVSSLRGLKDTMVAYVNDDIDRGNSSLVFPDFFLFFHNTVLDLQYASKRGLLDGGEARVIQDALIETMAGMDAAFKRNLRGKVTKMLGARMIADSPADSLDAGVHEALQDVANDLKALFQAFPQDLYLAIYG